MDAARTPAFRLPGGGGALARARRVPPLPAPGGGGRVGPAALLPPEEALYRGFLIWYLGAVFGLPLWGATAVAALVFGLAHIYQGVRGAAATTALGGVFGAMFGLTGSLAWPAAIHFLVDARILALPLPDSSAPAPASSRG